MHKTVGVFGPHAQNFLEQSRITLPKLWALGPGLTGEKGRASAYGHPEDSDLSLYCVAAERKGQDSKP